jgi:hypothetical protein
MWYLWALSITLRQLVRGQVEALMAHRRDEADYMTVEGIPCEEDAPGRLSI